MKLHIDGPFVRSFFCFALLSILMTSCGSKRVVSSRNVLFKEDLAEGRVVDVTRVKKLTGMGSLLIFKRPKYTYMLEGYIRGIITDYDHRPIEGVVVRAVLTQAQSTKKRKKKEETSFGEEGAAPAEGAVSEITNFDPGITDADGAYRIRFSLPVIDKLVDVRGKVLYNPGWAQQFDALGQSYEPQLKESDFRLYYSEKDRVLVFSEGTRATVVRPVRNAEGKVAEKSLKGSPKPETVPERGAAQESRPASRTQQPAKQPEPAAQEEDFFKGFNFGP